MKNWLKYIIIISFMFIGVSKVGAREIACGYNLSNTLGFDFVYYCTASFDNNTVNCKPYKQNYNGYFVDLKENNLNVSDFEKNGKMVCPSTIYAEYNFNTDAFTQFTNYTVRNFSTSKFNPTEDYKIINIQNDPSFTSPDGSNPGNGEHYVGSCDALNETGTLLRQIYNLLKYLIPVLVIGVSVVDFLKVVINGEEKVFKDAWSKLVKRIIVGVVILILPVILSFVINLSGALDDYNVDKNNIFCIFR